MEDDWWSAVLSCTSRQIHADVLCSFCAASVTLNGKMWHKMTLPDIAKRI
jgi:hypothetical protein